MVFSKGGLMATIPNIAPQPPDNQMQMNADVQVAFTAIRAKSPMGEMVTVVPNELMTQIVVLWINSHPQEFSAIMREIKNKQMQSLDIIRTVQKSKNG